jgi:hypothetical protein
MTLVRLEEHLRLERCPFCNVDRPNLNKVWETNPKNSEGDSRGLWRFYQCARCGSIVTAWAKESDRYTDGIIPSPSGVSKDIPNKANSYLLQAVQSLHAPAGAIMLAASSIDAMLKEKGYKEGNLYPRIEQAAKDHLITDGMAKWAHQVRLDSNSQRHADHEASLPTEDEAKKAIKFAQAFGEFLFVLPKMVAKGIEDTSPKKSNK